MLFEGMPSSFWCLRISVSDLIPRVVAASCFALLATLGIGPAGLRAQETSAPEPTLTDPGPGSDSRLTMLPRSESDRYWVSGQVNFISQWHPTFRSPYSGPNSLSA